MKTIEELLPRLTPAERAWVTVGPRKYGWTVLDVVRHISAKTGEEADPATVEAYLQRNNLPVDISTEEGEIAVETQGFATFSNAMERDIEIALVSQLDVLGLRLFVDDDGRSGKQYPAGEHGYIDVLAVDRDENFVVIELKREAPRATIGQLAGYLAFVRKHLAKPKGRKVVGWILARPSSELDNRLLEESAEAVGIVVRWYRVRLEFIHGGMCEDDGSGRAA
jgi:RecB family endonuclease NucS